MTNLDGFSVRTRDCIMCWHVVDLLIPVTSLQSVPIQMGTLWWSVSLPLIILSCHGVCQKFKQNIFRLKSTANSTQPSWIAVFSCNNALLSFPNNYYSKSWLHHHDSVVIIIPVLPMWKKGYKKCVSIPSHCNLQMPLHSTRAAHVSIAIFLPSYKRLHVRLHDPINYWLKMFTAIAILLWCFRRAQGDQIMYGPSDCSEPSKYWNLKMNNWWWSYSEGYLRRSNNNSFHVVSLATSLRVWILREGAISAKPSQAKPSTRSPSESLLLFWK